ncbi:hypothetical protein [Streptococcus hyovaginalis]|uniref:hypothetical protein n=1 Tax=Streptococcus hyovaginalis TaxID=149015 RepID=UPI001478F77C|nr:hypothetical protein [Streptococcus hyovaginalis]
MPQNAKERYVFSISMALIMGAIMTAWNLWWDDMLRFSIFLPSYLLRLAVSLIVLFIIVTPLSI